MDSSLLARSPGESKCLWVQHRAERDDVRFQRFLLQLHHAEHRRLRRYHACLKDCALACSSGSDDRVALCHRFNCTPSFTLFHAKVSMMELNALDFIKTLGVSFAALFPIVNPVGDAPIFFGLTQN